MGKSKNRGKKDKGQSPDKKLLKRKGKKAGKKRRDMQKKPPKQPTGETRGKPAADR